MILKLVMWMNRLDNYNNSNSSELENWPLKPELSLRQIFSSGVHLEHVYMRVSK